VVWSHGVVDRFYSGSFDVLAAVLKGLALLARRFRIERALEFHFQNMRLGDDEGEKGVRVLLTNRPIPKPRHER